MMKKKAPLKRMDATLSNNNHLIVGASGSGKSAYIRENIGFKHDRIVAFDPDEDFKLPRARDLRTFENIVKKAGFGKIRVALTVEPIEENFERFCQLVFPIMHCKAPIKILIDELADVARIGKASPHWGQLSRKCRKYGGTLYVCTQSPQEIDKTVLRQTRKIVCGTLQSVAAWKAMALNLDIPLAEIKQLENIERVQVQHWVRDGTRPAEKHTLKFKGR